MMLSDHGADVVKVEPPGGDPQRVVRRLGRHEPRASAASCSTSTTRPTATACSRSSPPPTCSSRASRPATSPARGLDYDDRRRRAARRSCTARSPGTRAPPTPPTVPPSICSSRPARACSTSSPASARARSSCTRRCRASPRRTSRSEGVLAALYAREITGRGQWVETSLYQGVLAFTTQLWQDAEHRVEPWVEIGPRPAPEHLRVRRRPVGPLDARGRRSGQGPQRRSGRSSGIDPPDLDWNPTQCQASTIRSREAIGRMKRQDLLDQFWANEIPIAPVRHAHEALEDEQVVNNGMSVVVDDPVHGAGAPGRHRLPPARGARRRRCRARNRCSASTPTRCSDRWRGTDAPCARGAARRSDRSPTRSRASRSSTSATSSPARSGRCCSATSARPSTSSSRPRATRCGRSPQPFNGCQRGKLDVVVDLKTARGPGDRAPADPRGRRRPPQHAPRRRRATRRRLRDRQAAQPDRHLLPHHDVGQRRAARHVARVRPARAVVVRARARARRRGQRTQLVPLRHVRPGVRGAVGARGADGAVLARAHRRGAAASTRRS